MLSVAHINFVFSIERDGLKEAWKIPISIQTHDLLFLRFRPNSNSYSTDYEVSAHRCVIISDSYMTHEVFFKVN